MVFFFGEPRVPERGQMKRPGPSPGNRSNHVDVFFSGQDRSIWISSGEENSTDFRATSCVHFERPSPPRATVYVEPKRAILSANGAQSDAFRGDSPTVVLGHF